MAVGRRNSPDGASSGTTSIPYVISMRHGSSFHQFVRRDRLLVRMLLGFGFGLPIIFLSMSGGRQNASRVHGADAVYSR
jgi:hypothetical protein